MNRDNGAINSNSRSHSFDRIFHTVDSEDERTDGRGTGIGEEVKDEKGDHLSTLPPPKPASSTTPPPLPTGSQSRTGGPASGGSFKVDLKNVLDKNFNLQNPYCCYLLNNE